MPKSFTYTDAGVNRKQRIESKKALKDLRETYKYSRFRSIMRFRMATFFLVGENTFLIWPLKE